MTSGERSVACEEKARMQGRRLSRRYGKQQSKKAA